MNEDFDPRTLDDQELVYQMHDDLVGGAGLGRYTPQERP